MVITLDHKYFFYVSALHFPHPHLLLVPFRQAPVQVILHPVHVVPLLAVPAAEAQVTAVVKVLHQAVVDPAQYHVHLAAHLVIQVSCALSSQF